MDDKLFLSKDAINVVGNIILLVATENTQQSKSWEVNVDGEEVSIIKETATKNIYNISNSFRKKIFVLSISQIKNIILRSNMSKKCKRKVLIYLSNQEDTINTNKRIDHLEEKINQINDHLKILIDALDLYKK